MENLTIENLKEIHILIIAMKSDLTESIEGVAKVAKAIQLYLGSTFSEAIEILNEFINEDAL
jgi:hypothetical protein